ncbi:alpha/beta fold hydrolase [Rhizobium sp. CF142]|uniref:alpha/beta fold hydrolase n=1 Tax=Rhizobium sp. CF142 TaxID=1144314 RepID=UPI00026EF171|nr:alpha/beta hydrolase [Rhizobium sp. CF142]EJJ26517.1 putative hydrolase or acyltransferase of alpha/beta superfamily [Rhizobium sp. CF142]
MSTGLIEGFQQRRLPGDGVEIDALVAGDGPPLLLLHGWPQTRMCWSRVAPDLARHFTVVVPDLRGYGRSDKPEDSADHQTYSKRAMARDQIAAMRALGFERFAVGAHDRGARVAYRLAFDHPEAVTRLASLDVIPTADMWARMGAREAVSAWHWAMLAQPDGLAEKLVGADPEWFVRYILSHQSGQGFAIPEENMADYLACARDPRSVHAWAEDYRAGWTIDRELDEQDRGRKLDMPLLMLWGEHGTLKGKDGLEPWRGWAERVEGEALPCGHFIPEEAPDAVIAHFTRFFGAGA